MPIRTDGVGSWLDTLSAGERLLTDMLVPFQTTQEILLSATVVLCLLLAVAVIVLMWMRTRPREDGAEPVRPPFDPVLLGSAVAVVVMAVVAWTSL